MLCGLYLRCLRLCVGTLLYVKYSVWKAVSNYIINDTRHGFWYYNCIQ